MHSITTITYIDDKLISEWKELWDHAENANMFNSYEYFLTSLELDKNKEYKIYACYQNKKLVAVLPLQQYSCFGIKVWGSINKEHLVDTPFLMEKYDKNLLKSFFSTIFAGENIYMQKVDSEASDLLHKNFSNLLFSLLSVNPVVSLADDPFKSVSESTVKQLKRIIRKNEKELRFEMHSTDLQKHMQTIIRFQKNTSKSKKSMDVFSDDYTKKYYVGLVKNFAKTVRIFFLYFDNKLIAYQYGFMYRDIFVGDQIAYHDEYRKLRPGKLVVYYLLETLKKYNINLLDQGGGISSYKMEFASDYRLLYNVYYSKNIFIMLWWKLINKIRRLKQLLFPKKFTRDHEFLFKTL